MKKDIRNTLLKTRDRIPSDIRAQKDLCIRETLLALPEFVSAGTILLYASFRSEVATGAIIRESIATGKKVLLPKVDAKNVRLILYQIESIEELSPGYMGIPEPNLNDERRRSIDEADIAIVPGAGFDLSGNRLGYGAGYYDALLSARKRKTPVVAIAYEEQIVDAMPAEVHDVKVDIIITDLRVIRIA